MKKALPATRPLLPASFTSWGCYIGLVWIRLCQKEVLMKQELFLLNTNTQPDSSFAILLTGAVKVICWLCSLYRPWTEAGSFKVLTLRWHKGPECFPDFRTSFWASRLLQSLQARQQTHRVRDGVLKPRGKFGPLVGSLDWFSKNNHPCWKRLCNEKSDQIWSVHSYI